MKTIKKLMQKILDKINKRLFRTIIFYVILFVFFASPHFINAQSIFLTSNKLNYAIGEDIPVAVVLNTGGKTINAMDGAIRFSPQFFDISNITIGNSIFSLWPERPAVGDDGIVVFSGGVPHGFKGNSGNIFSFTLKSKKSGISSVFINNATVLLNDGLGTKLSGVEFIPLALSINPQSVSPQKPEQPKQPVIDNIPPEHFTPIISKTPYVAMDRYFVSFSTVDKQSGISYYQVREEYVVFPFFGVWLSTDWQKTETPYVLTLQHWWSRVLVRAYDVAGNYREEIANKPIDAEGITALYNLSVVILIIILILIFILIRKFKKKSNAKK